MPVRFDDPRPPYAQLAAELREAIRTGALRPGDRLPSTRQLAEDNGIAPMTVQHALRILRDEGLVVGQQGRGVFVQEPSATPSQPDSGKGQTASTEATEPDSDAVESDAYEQILQDLAAVKERLDALETRAEVDTGLPPPDQGPGVEL